MLDPQVLVNLLLKLGVRMNLVRHGNFRSEGLSEKAFCLTTQDIVCYRAAAMAHGWDF